MATCASCGLPVRDIMFYFQKGNDLEQKEKDSKQRFCSCTRKKKPASDVVQSSKTKQAKLMNQPLVPTSISDEPVLPFNCANAKTALILPSTRLSRKPRSKTPSTRISLPSLLPVTLTSANWQILGTSPILSVFCIPVLSVAPTGLKTEGDIAQVHSLSGTCSASAGIHGEAVPQNNYIAPILLRKPLTDLLSDLKKEVPGKAGRTLCGAAGSGKSTILYVCAWYARLRGDIVLYAICGDVVDSRSAHPSCRLLDALFKDHSLQLEELSLFRRSADDPDVVLRDTVYALTTQTKYRVLIALDQWNAIFGTKSGLEDCFGSLLSLENGMMITAVSSSFDPMRKLRDADFETLQIEIKPYSDLEWEKILEATRILDQLPAFLATDTLKRETGKLARLLLFAKQGFAAVRDSNYPDAQITKHIIEDVRNRAGQYYRTRITKLFSATEDMEKIADVAARVAVHDDITEIPRICQISGLFTLNTLTSPSVYEPVCPIVQNILVTTLADESQSKRVLQILASQKLTRWRALELAVTLSFQKACHLQICALDLQGQRIPDPVRIECSKFHDQFWIGDVGTTGQLAMGTVLACAPRHPVVDLIVYTPLDELIFIQISEGPYRAHHSKVRDLWNNTSVHGEEQEKQFNVLKYYASKLPPRSSLKQRIGGFLSRSTAKSKGLPGGVYYLYVTTSTEFYKNPTVHDGGFVHLVMGAQFKALIGEYWDCLSPYCELTYPQPRRDSLWFSSATASVFHELSRSVDENDDENDSHDDSFTVHAAEDETDETREHFDEEKF